MSDEEFNEQFKKKETRYLPDKIFLFICLFGLMALKITN